MEAGYRAFRHGCCFHYTQYNLQHSRKESISSLIDCAQACMTASARTETSVSISPEVSDLSDAIREMWAQRENLAPFFVEDPVRTEAFQEDFADPAPHRQSSIARGRRVGQLLGLHQANREPRSSTMPRVTLPTVGGITEMMKIAATGRDAVLSASCRISPALYPRPRWSIASGHSPGRC